MAYKPFGMLSQLNSNDPKEVRSKHFLGELYPFPEGIMPIGRLDAKSEGLLLLTTDGKLSDFINRFGVEKQYYAQMDGEIDEKAVRLLRKGVEIGSAGQKVLSIPKEVSPLPCPPEFPLADPSLRLGRHRPTSWISITLTEGKFRQVRKMTAAVGFPTLRLVRIRIGDMYLGNMQPGETVPVDIPSLFPNGHDHH
tara:strand:- start:5477 stop:6061 length:585 start_codon:yes stop_codon:yes gene_type:complete